MTLECWVAIQTVDGEAIVQIEASSLHQIALVMPATVVSYEVRRHVDLPERTAIGDTALFKSLLRAIKNKLRSGIVGAPTATGVRQALS